MKLRHALLLAAVLIAPLSLAADPAADYEKRLAKIQTEEASAHFALGKYCEGVKMWKPALEEYRTVIDLVPDNRAAEERLDPVGQKAEVSASRPTAAEEARYTQGVLALRRNIGKKYRDLAAWAKSQGLIDEFEDATALADELEGARKSSDPRQAAVDYINRMRRKSGLAPVTLSPGLSAGAQKHAEYLVRNNNHPSTRGLGAHNEDPALPGYTAEGERAGHQSDIGQRPPLSSMAGMFGVFYHRIPLLHPDLREIGIGYAAVAEKGTPYESGWCAIDFSGVRKEKDEKAPRVVSFPAPGQKRVPLEFCSREEPDPIPAGEDQSCGTPITLTWFDKPTIADATMEVTLKGVPVKGYFSSPDSPARGDFPNLESLCFMSADPLVKNSVYHVKVTATVDGEAFVREWDFTTGAQLRDE